MADNHYEAQVLPLVQVAIAARVAKDFMGSVLALNKLFAFDEIRVYAAFGALTGAAALAVPANTVPGETWTPKLIAGNPPVELDPLEDPSARFVFAYLAAYIRQDPDAAVEMWTRFAYVPEDAPEEETNTARLNVSKAFVLMLQLAARGAEIKLERDQQRRWRHPRARAASRGRHQHRH